ncbi:MAG: DUF2267 domain-containing protein [Anaerolineaceae bacterium]|nr:DUF2267 domain-containing protein [Anaerolineaceae bacterium]
MQRDEFLKKVQDYSGLDSEAEALQMTEIFLATLGEWVYRTEANKLSAQLPAEFQDFMFKQQDPEQVRGQTVHLPLEEFYNRIKSRADVRFKEAEDRARATARVLAEAVSPGALEPVLQELPEDFRQLFTAVSS